MNTLKKKFIDLKVWAHRPRNKKRIYLAMLALLVLWFVYRFVMVGIENRRYVFNPSRVASESGLVIETLDAKKTTGILREPLSVKNNRALVSGGRVSLLKPGQKIGNGTIVSVSSNIDLDTGMHRVTTRGVSDGLNYAEYQITGYFVPSYAIKQDTVYVMENGVAVARNVHVANSDAEQSVITSGLQDGDVIILSNVADGIKVKVK
ncbi:MAG: hypothetical protein NC311_00070 [Muribaculaceae bacterium]|nr:hypothetical protein [Muribaculaceae bacterium]